LAICRALGIISKIITEPYYERSADEKTTALSMGNVYNRLINILALSTENPDLLLTNQISLFFGPFLPPSPVSQSLFKPCHLDIHTRNILTCLCTSLKSKCESLFKDFLDGGKYYEPSFELIEMTKSCPPNNIPVECLMAKLDCQLKAAPSANVSTIESSVMFRNNQTSSWLDEKDDIKQNSIVTSARKQNAYMINQRKERKQQLYMINQRKERKQQLYMINQRKERKQQLLKDHQKIIQERESAKKLKLEKKEKENAKMRENMAKIGIWNEIDIECKLDEIKCKSGKIQAIKKTD
jgi:hypothetical protein